MFRHHPDGLIYIDDVTIPLELFQRLEPDYRLPDGYVGREYDPGAVHMLYTGNRADPRPLDWAEGDRYIGKKAHYACLMRRMYSRPYEPLLDRKVKALW